MERESFEDEEIAQYINENFIAIKVDREERPDIDDIYMGAVHLLHGRGGWPMTVVMTPMGEPFFGGTYFPARDGDRGVRKGFFTLLRELSHRYRTDPEGVVQHASDITQKLKAQAQPQIPGGVPKADVIQKTAGVFARRFDARWGGFGRHPKFPRPVALDFLMRYHRRTGDSHSMHMAAFTLDKMAAGGLHDQIGGGFHRYTVDERWRVPHFEKMLYDNAQLAMAYLDAYQITKNPSYRQVVDRTLEYVLREMTHQDGGFFSATDADSPTPTGHREEGWFFTWTSEEVEAVVGADALNIVRVVYGLTTRGNFEGRNIMYVPRPLSDSARRLKMSESDLRSALDRIRAALYRQRAQRPPPILDDKVLVAWNGLMISAMSRAGRILNNQAYIRSAQKNAHFLLANVRTPEGRLLRTWRNGVAKLNGYLEDYAFLIAGLLDLYEATGEVRWVDAALQLQQLQDRHYGAPLGYYTTSDDHETLLTREQPNYDGAQPAGNSVTAMNLLRLYTLTSDEKYQTRADGIFKAFSQTLTERGISQPALLSALEMRLDSPLQIIVIGPKRGPMDQFDEVIGAHYLPNKALIRIRQSDVDQHVPLVPILDNKTARDGRTTVYVCEDNVCQKPTSDPHELSDQLMRLTPLVSGMH